MTDEAEFHQNKLASKTYISRRIVTDGGTKLRIASKVMDSPGYQYAKEKNELVLRRTPAGRKEIVAKFLEDDRSLHVVTIQSFNGKTGAPHRTYFSFVGQEIKALLTFFENIASVEQPLCLVNQCKHHWRNDQSSDCQYSRSIRIAGSSTDS